MLKDLRSFNLDINKCILVDNSIVNLYVNLDNGIPIIPFYGNKEDRELK